MIAFIQIFTLFTAMLLGSGCTYNKFSQSVPYGIEGDGWRLSKKWVFLSGAGTVTGHGLDFNIRVENKDQVSELWFPVNGWHKQDPFIVTIYINSIENDLWIDWRSLRVDGIGKEIPVKKVRGPYAIPWSECNPRYIKFKNPVWVIGKLKDDIKEKFCLFLEFNASNSEVPWTLRLELNGLKKNNETIPSFKVLFSE